MKETWVRFLGREDPLEGRKWQLTPIFLPGESQGQEPRRLQSVGSQELDTIQPLNQPTINTKISLDSFDLLLGFIVQSSAIISPTFNLFFIEYFKIIR